MEYIAEARKMDADEARGLLILALQDCHAGDGEIQLALSKFNLRLERTRPEVAAEVARRWYSLEP